ncbi:hypothetical protein [Companilactobacillus mishanensis]|nr:hypothetical protein [Companilactobacillus mishanensis]
MGLEDDYMVKQLSQISKALAKIVGKSSSDKIINFEVKQDQKDKPKKKNK